MEKKAPKSSWKWPKLYWKLPKSFGALSPGCPGVALKICEAQGVSPRRRFRTGSPRPLPQRLARASWDLLGHAPEKA